MKIKKYEGKNEQEVMQRVKDELGITAIILSVKRKPYKGFLAFFKSPIVVVTAAYEEVTSAEKLWDEKRAVQKQAQSYLMAREQERAQAQSNDSTGSTGITKKTGIDSAERMLRDVQLLDQQQRIASLEGKLQLTEELLEKVVAQLNVAEQMARDPKARKYDDNMTQLFYESLLHQGVTPEIAEKLLEDVECIDDREKIDLTLIVKIVYNIIIGILGDANGLELDASDDNTQVVAFMGPTGVGKTTTIAKLSSVLALNQNVRVGLITADTYRIAAVEQLKTYAEILGLDVQVVYNNEDVENNLNLMRPMNDMILIDTAGRSHRNEENLTELKELLDTIPDCKRYLVLSVTTKCEDLLHIVNTYSTVTDFELIFTKLDETTSLGSILNICDLTGKKVSYVTFGQSVPEDIEVIQPDKLAKALLGLGPGAGQPYKRRGGKT